MRVNLDSLDEVRDKTSQKMMRYQQKMAEYYNKRLKLRKLNIGDLVIRKVMQATKDPTQRKLGPTWEGPYKIIHYLRQGSYHLETVDGKKLPRLWNIKQLKKLLEKHGLYLIQNIRSGILTDLLHLQLITCTM